MYMIKIVFFWLSGILALSPNPLGMKIQMVRCAHLLVIHC